MDCRIGEKDKERAERMVRIALWCVQYKPESRPLMSNVVNMLEGSNFSSGTSHATPIMRKYDIAIASRTG